MLTRLHFKNWRSLRDVEISDLAPITVFIGPNSSGKTNIVDSLHFLQTAVSKDTLTAISNRGGRENILSFSATADDGLEVETSFHLADNPNPFTYKLAVVRENNVTKFRETLTDVDDTLWLRASDAIGVIRDQHGDQKKASSSYESLLLAAYGRREDSPHQIQETFRFIAQRLQILGENGTVPTNVDFTFINQPDLYTIDPTGYNAGFILDTMQREFPHLFNDLRADLGFLLEHVDQLDVFRGDQRVRLAVKEKTYPDREVPTISAGTSRIIAMLTAFYALDMRNGEQPGLVVIEEPDISIHPLLLGNLVELLRGYTEREGHPRQFILTTHNPQMLNYFEPHEVRIVERGEDGATTVRPIDEKVADAWRQQDGAFNLGSLWTTRLIGGVPR